VRAIAPGQSKLGVRGVPEATVIGVLFCRQPPHGRRVGAVFKRHCAPDRPSRIAITATGGIDAAWHAVILLLRLRNDLAHCHCRPLDTQKPAAVLGHFDNRGDSQRIVCGKLRIE